MKYFNSRILTGILLIAFGVLFLLGNIGTLTLNDFLSTWWPTLVVVVGLVVFLNNVRSWVFPLFLVAFGVLLQLDQLEIIAVDTWQILWPTAIIAVGVSIIVDRFKGVNSSDRGRHSITAFMGGSEEKNNSQDYKGGKISAVLGGTSLDLRKAVIKDDAYIEVLAVMGGAEIFVPDGVVVEKQMTHILGGTEDKTAAPTAKNAPVLHLVGTLIMGGVEIKN